jgi:hypothetical protein
MNSYNAVYDTYSGTSHDNELKVIDNTQMYVDFLDMLENSKCKILFSINDCALTRFVYKYFIKKTDNHMYVSTHKNIMNLNEGKTKKTY